jgi:radical SAM protein with 4Fe4S-binding SPASM domain
MLFHTLYLEVTRKCNFKCAYCSSGSNNKALWEQTKTIDEIEKYILLPAKQIGTNFIDFSGGEPFLYPSFLHLLNTANQMGFKIGISTNGSLLNSKLIEKLKKILGNNLLISLGINSFDNKNAETRCKETDYFLKKLELLTYYGVNVNISITMGRFNFETFAESCKNIRKLSLPFNRIPYAPRNSKESSLMFDKQLLKQYFHAALMESYHGFVSFIPFFLNPEDYKQITRTNINTAVPVNPSIGCWVGSFYAINPSGEVAPCPLLSDNISVGNVYKTPLKEILYESDLMKKIIDRSNLKGKCKTCKYNWTCGGCRVMAYYNSGDVFDEDPTCFIDELSTEELYELELKTRKHFKNFVRMNEINKTRLNLS